ncbi:MAG: Mpo1-like protein [Sandaracinaceae bacterium]
MGGVSEALYEARTFDAFYAEYLRAHAHPTTRRLHAMATLSAGALIGYGVLASQPLAIVAAPLVDYAIAQASHRTVERNVTRPWRRIPWHVRAELRMCRATLRDWRSLK